MQLHPNFISNMQEIYGQNGLNWVKELPDLITQLCRKWNTRFVEVVPNLSYNFVGLVERLDSGEIAIIKMAFANEHILEESRWLKCFDRGVAKIYEFDDTYHAILMERIEPGEMLSKLVKEGKDDTATQIICKMILELGSRQQRLYEFKHLSELAASLPILTGHIDNKLLSKAQTLFRELTTDRNQDVILHGDLHHYNILASGSGWKAIDPHGYIGDPVFEVGPMIYNPFDCFPDQRSLAKTIERRLKILAEELPFDAQRIKAWTFCMTLLSLAWTYEANATVPDFEVEIAAIINKTVV